MAILSSYSRTQNSGEFSSDCQYHSPLLANTKDLYRFQQQGVEDRFGYDADCSQQDARPRTLDYNGSSSHPTLGPKPVSHHEMDIDKNNPAPPVNTEPEPQPLRPYPAGTVLERGVQIPTRVSYITSGFRLPRALCDAGVDRARWAAFTREVTAYGRMSKSQWATVLGCSCAFGLLVDCVLPLSGQLVLAPVVGHKKRRNKEQENFRIAFASGGLQLVTDRWNKILFEPLGLQVLIEPPNCFGASNMATMDVSSTKLYRYQEKKGLYASTTGGVSESADKKEIKYAGREGRYRTKAARKGRILIRPIQREQTQAVNVESAAVSPSDCVGQLDGVCKSQPKSGQESSGQGAGYTSLPAAGPSKASRALEVCTLATRLVTLAHGVDAAAFDAM